MTKSNFWLISPLELHCKTSDGWPWDIYWSINLKFGMKPSFAQPKAHANIEAEIKKNWNSLLRVHQVSPNIYHTYSKNRVTVFLCFKAKSAIFKIWVFWVISMQNITLYVIDIHKIRCFRTFFATLWPISNLEGFGSELAVLAETLS